VAVVTIDARSLRAYGDWPWPRSRHAEAIRRIEAAGALAIAFDIDFSSPSSGEEDLLLAESLRENGHVVLATFSQFESIGGGAELEIVNRPIPRLEEEAAGLGSVLVPIDRDGVVRYAPRTSLISDQPIPSLARAALVAVASREAQERIRFNMGSGATSRIDYRRVEPEIPTVAYGDLMDGRFEFGKLAGRVVFIGATAAEFQDLWTTPVAPALPGVFIQAIAYRTAAAEAAGERVLSGAPLPWIAAAYLGLGLLFLPRSGTNRLLRLGAAIGAAVGLVALSWFSLWQWGIVVPATVGLILIAVQYAFGIESLQKRIQEHAAAQESSLSALARLGDANLDGCDSTADQAPGNGRGLELALELLGEVVVARGVILLRTTPEARLTGEQLQWRPADGRDDELELDLKIAEKALLKRSSQERMAAGHERAPVVYTPLLAGSEPVGVLAVFCNEGQKLDALQRRTIATVAAQMALTAQNLRLIERLRVTFESSIAAVAGAVEARDGYTDQHCRRLAAFSSMMGIRIGMTDDEIRAMELGALLHDVGKIGVPDSILNKAGRLSNDERRVMERHPEIGAGIVAPVVGLEKTTLDCVIHHHERWNGQGYPEGLMGEEIPLAARIVSIVDVWDALSTQRPYKRAFSQEEVRDVLLKERGRQFDPELIDLFFEVLEDQGEEMLELIARSSSTESFT
jgi:HD-GYP domain-containing protein (c-di-GMP phosphodiesterase class II)